MSVQHDLVIQAVNSRDYRRAIKLLEELAAPRGSRELDDVVETISRELAARGTGGLPAGIKSAKSRPAVRKAVVGLTSFMEQHTIKQTTRNRTILLRLIVGYIVDSPYIETEGHDPEIAERIEAYNKAPQYMRVLQMLSDVNRTTAAINVALPGYLQSRNLHMFGIEYAKDNPRIPPTPQNEADLENIAAGFPPTPEPVLDSVEMERQEFEEMREQQKQRERIQDRVEANTSNGVRPAHPPQPPVPGLGIDGAITI